MADGFTYRPSYLLAPGQPSPGRPTLLRPPIATQPEIGTGSARRPAPDRSP